MVAFNMLWKLFVVMALGLSAKATCNDIPQEQPKKESFVSRFFGKKGEHDTKPVVIPEEEIVGTLENIDSEEYTEKGDPPKFSVEWYLLPEPESRRHLLDRLPWDLAMNVPNNSSKAILPVVEKRIRKFFSLSEKQQMKRREYTYGLRF